MKKILFFIFLSCSLFANLAGQAPTKIALRCPAPNPSSYSSISTIFIGDIIHTPCPNRSSIFTGKVNFSGSTLTGLFPVTTKGDLFTFSNVAARLGVGVNGQILSADNTTATGLKWVTGTGGTVTSVTSANGNATVANTTTTPVITIVQAPALKSATTTVDVSAATAPSANQVLTATNSTTATWQTPAAPGVGTVTSVTSANGNATVANTTTTPVITIVQAPALKSATTTVDVSAATAPSANQVLTATNSTTATWQTPAAPGVGTVTSVTSANGNATVANTTTTPVITIVQAPALKSATTTVDVSAATAPSANQVLTATNSTTATWQTPAAPGVGTVTSVTSANGNATVANTTTTPVITIVKAPAWTTARNLAGNSVDGSGNVAFATKFIVQGTTDTGLSGPQFLGALGTGIVKNTTTTGVLSIAANSDLPVMSATVGGAVPTPPNNTTTFLRGDGTFNTPASSGVTNSAGNNVVTKSNGTNLVASRITDSGTVIDIGDSQNQGAGIFFDKGASKEVDLGDVGNNNNLTHISIQDSTANKSISLQRSEERRVGKE